ncbi:MAG: hypothetical protein WAL84_02280 [Candidatus Dormiibacterota bacterium]
MKHLQNPENARRAGQMKTEAQTAARRANAAKATADRVARQIRAREDADAAWLRSNGLLERKSFTGHVVS